MRKAGLYYCLILLSFIALTECQNKTKTSAEEKDLFELINYPSWMDTLDCSDFTPDWKPYPCLKLHKKTIQEIDSLYGKPLYTRIDTLYNGLDKNGAIYDQDITVMLSRVPVATVKRTYRVSGYNLFLFFIDYNKQDVVFWGYLIGPDRMTD